MQATKITVSVSLTTKEALLLDRRTGTGTVSRLFVRCGLGGCHSSHAEKNSNITSSRKKRELSEQMIESSV